MMSIINKTFTIRHSCFSETLMKLSMNKKFRMWNISTASKEKKHWIYMKTNNPISLTREDFIKICSEAEFNEEEMKELYRAYYTDCMAWKQYI